MTGVAAVSTEAATYEGLADLICSQLRRQGVLPGEGVPTPWESFLALSDLVHSTYSIPATSLTPMMRRLLFALGFASRPRRIVAVGSHVGYALTWLLRDRGDGCSAPFLQSAVGFDIDEEATASARCNCAVLGHGDRLSFQARDGVEALASGTGAIDLLYLDLEDPRMGKRGYCDALRAASWRLKPQALVLAHDPFVRKFARDFSDYHDLIRASPTLAGPWLLPVDECGLSVAVAVRESRGEAGGAA